MWKELYLTITVIGGNRRDLSGLPLPEKDQLPTKIKNLSPDCSRLVSHKLRDIPQVVLCLGGGTNTGAFQVGHKDALEQLQIKYSAFGAFIKG